MRVDPTYINNLVSALDQSQTQQQQLSAEMSSGVRVNSLSEDPIAAGQNVLLLSQIQQDDSFTESASEVTGQLQVTDSTLGQVVTQLDSAISLATSANNGTMNSSDRASISSELAGILSEVISLANTSYQGQYIFGGGTTTTAPFSLSSATTPATVTYNGDENVNYLETPNGQKIQLNVPGNQIFDASSSNSVFKALSNLVADYASGSSATASQAISDTQTLSSALNYVSQQRVTLDNSISQLSDSSTAIQSQETQLTAAQTNLMQADVAKVSTQLALTETQQTALESIISQLASGSLFDKIAG